MTKWTFILSLWFAALSAQAAPYLTPGLMDRYAPDDYSPYPSVPQMQIAPGAPVTGAPYGQPPAAWGATPPAAFGYGYPPATLGPSWWGGGQSFSPGGGAVTPWSPWGNSFWGSPFSWW